jgi:hypothetical protein
MIENETKYKNNQRRLNLDSLESISEVIFSAKSFNELEDSQTSLLNFFNRANQTSAKSINIDAGCSHQEQPTFTNFSPHHSADRSKHHLKTRHKQIKKYLHL